MLEVGDRVRLVDRIGRMAQKEKYGRPYFDWRTRRGEIVAITHYTNAALVKWDGRKSPDQWPLHTLEKVA